MFYCTTETHSMLSCPHREGKSSHLDIKKLLKIHSVNKMTTTRANILISAQSHMEQNIWDNSKGPLRNHLKSSVYNRHNYTKKSDKFYSDTRQPLECNNFLLSHKKMKKNRLSLTEMVIVFQRLIELSQNSFIHSHYAMPYLDIKKVGFLSSTAQ